MNVEIRTLTGPDQGSRKVLEAKRLWIGETDDCDIQFDASQIPEAAGRCVEIQLTENGWILTNIGSGEIRVNQDFVDDFRQIKPGDVIRLSENGPDFSFGLVRPGVIMSDETKETGSEHVVIQIFASLWTAASGIVRRHPTAVVGVAGVVLLVLLCLSFNWIPWRVFPPQPEVNRPPDVEPIPTLVLSEENDYVLDYQVRASDPDQVNRPPDVEPIPTLVLSEENDYVLDYQVRASDPDQPDTTLHYQLSPSVPDGMTVDPALGRIRWKPTESQLGESYAVMLTVSEPENPNVVTSVPFLVRSVVVKQSQGVKDALYVVTLTSPDGQQEYPLANAVAVTSNGLITTAVVAHEVQRRKQQGWNINVVLGSRGIREPVQDILIHQSNRQLAEDPAAQIYVDLAILQVQERQDRVVAELASEAELEKLEPGYPLRCLIIKHNGEPLTSFDDTEPVFYDGRLHSREQLIPDPHSPIMLHLQAELPKHSHGCGVFNKQDKLLAIFVETAAFPEDSDLAQLNGRLHYAPGLSLLRSWIDQKVDLQQDWERPVPKPDQEHQPP